MTHFRYTQLTTFFSSYQTAKITGENPNDMLSKLSLERENEDRLSLFLAHVV